MRSLLAGGIAVFATFVALASAGGPFSRLAAEAGQSPDDAAPSTPSAREPLAVPTFHCIGVYWSPEAGGAGKKVLVKFRESGQDAWRDGLPMRHHPVDTPECKADYRGSIVNLRPGTAYEIALELEGTDTRASLESATWSERSKRRWPARSLHTFPSRRLQRGRHGQHLRRRLQPRGAVSRQRRSGLRRRLRCERRRTRGHLRCDHRAGGLVRRDPNDSVPRHDRMRPRSHRRRSGLRRIQRVSVRGQRSRVHAGA